MQAKSAITIADKYVLVRKLATDATTELYLARKTDASGGVAQVVVRRLLSELANRKDLQEMYREEARIAAALDHPNILRVVEVGGAAADPYIAMEFIQGHPLSRVQLAQAQKGSGIPPQFGLAMVLDVARGLYYAHEKTDVSGKSMGILHRFLSPQKIVVGYDGVSRIIDFGVTRPWFRVNEGDPVAALDRVRYLAPEQVKGQPVGPWTDIFSLGSILYEITTGRPPFDGENPAEVTRAIAEAKPIPPCSFVPGYPEEMEKLVLTALAAVPGERFPNGAALAAALELFLVRHEITAQATAPNVAGYLRGLFGAGAVAPGPGAAAASAPVRKSELDLPADDDVTAQTAPSAGPREVDLELGDLGGGASLELQEITGSLLLPAAPSSASAPAASAPAAPKPAPVAKTPPKPAPAAPTATAPWDEDAAPTIAIPAPAAVAPAPPAPVPAAPVKSGPSPEELQLRERVTTLAKENTLLRQEVIPLREELSILRPDLATTKTALEAMLGEKAKLDAAHAKLSEELAALRTELAAAKADASAAAASASAREISTQQRIEAAIAREDQAKKDLDAAAERESKTRRDLEVYKARDGAMRKELEAVKQREAAAKAELEAVALKESVLEKSADELKRVVDLAKRESELAKREAAGARAEAETAKKASEAKEAAVARQIEAIQREADAKRDAAVASIEAATKRIKAEGEAAKAELEATKAAATKAQLEVAKLKRELDEAKGEIGVAQQALQAVLEENAQKGAIADESGKKAATASEEADQARKGLEAAKADAEAAIKAAASARLEAEAALKEANAAREERAIADAAAKEADERRRALEMAEEEQAAARKAEVAAAMQVVRTAMQEADAARAEAASLKAAADAARADSEAARAEALAAHERAEEARAEAEKARTEAEATRAAAEKARAEAAEAKKAAEVVLTEANAIAQEAEEKKAEAAQALEQEREQRSKRDAEQKEIEEAQMQVLSTAMRSIEIAKQESDDALQAATLAKAEADEARAEANVARAQAEAARGQAEASRREAEASRRDADAAKREADAMRREAEGTKREAEALRAAAESAKREAENAKREADAAKREAEGARRETESAKREQAAAPAPAAPKAAPAKPEPPRPAEAPDSAPTPISRPLDGAVRKLASGGTALPKSNLIAIPGAFVGRGDTLRALEPLVLGNVSQVTLVGMPGSGRTRLARRFASMHLNELSKGGGVWFVDLAGLSDPGAICAATASALGVAIPPSRDSSACIDHLAAILGARGKLLLILDGADQAVEALPAILETWRSSSKELRTLLVAEKPLGLGGERVLEPGSLALPAADAAADSEAGRLFVARAREQSRDGNPPPPAADPDVCRIVRLLRGGPLAIELIAARSEDFTIAALYNDLADTLGPAASDPSSLLAGVLDWSWSRLATWEQDALAQASVFASDFTAEAAGAVVDLSAHPDAPPIEEVLRALVAAALLRVRSGADARDPERFEMHPSVRDFSAARLQESADAAAPAGRHTAWALRAGRALASSLEGPSANAALRRLELFHRDLDATAVRAIAAAPATRASAEVALEAVRALEPLWLRRGLLAVGIERTTGAIAAADAPGVDAALKAEARLLRGRLRRIAGKLADADADLQLARVGAAAAEDRRFEARVLAELGLTLQARGQGELARASLDQALALARREKDARIEAQLLGHLGALSRDLGRTELARNCYEQAAAIAATLGDKRLEAEVCERAGASARDMGALDEARRYLERAAGLAPAVQDRGFDGRILAALADIALEQQRLDEARELYKAAFEPLAQLGLRRDEAVARGNLGILEHLDGHLDDAKARFATASRLLDDIGERALDGLYLAHLAALEAARGATDNAAAVFETAKRRIKEGGGGSALTSAAEVLTGFLEIARAKKAPDNLQKKTHRDAATKKIPDARAPAAARIAGALLKKAASELT